LLRGALKNFPVQYTREPGGTPYAEEIREMLLRPAGLGPTPHPLCDLFLFFAARASHIETLVWPGRDEGTHFISDRYDSSTFAFQIYGERRFDLERLFVTIRNSLSHHFNPDAYIFLDLPAEVAFERRAKDATQAQTRFDTKPLEYHQSVRSGFRDFKKIVLGGKGTVHIVDANRPPKVVHKEVVRIIRSVFRS
jgi:dTMP kinase